jgi:iron-sulfur cluster repair protein YtfE (RIC family)
VISEHAAFDQDLASLDAFLRSGNVTAAFMHLETFKAMLTRYISGEERVLFPVLERFVAVSAVTTAKMRSEHGRLQCLLDMLCEALEHQDWQSALETLCALRSVLLLHCEKEDRVLAPLLRVTGAVGLES